MRRLEMLKAREIIRMKYEVGLSLREIAQACGCGKSTVGEVLLRAENAGLKWPTELSDKQLMSALYPPMEKESAAPEPDMEYIFGEMKRKGVTLMLLWEEYKEKHPEGIMYTQFCDRYRSFKKNNKLTLHKEHKAGEEMEVDWAGQTIIYVDTSTGELKKAYVFVAVLPASAYPFVYAFCDMKTPSWIDAHIRAFEYFGGVPRITIPDNAKTAVLKSDLIDPVISKSYLDMARHYGTTILPARAGHPKDKGADENMVGNISRRIIGALRNRQFFSIHEINQAIKEELAKFVERPFQKMEGNRVTAFESIDKPALRPLPGRQYEYADWKEAKVQFNYHVEYDGFFYSVHYSYVGKLCSVRATAKTIEIYMGSERIWAYPRNYNTFKRYTTLPEHMPDEHKAVTGWSSDRFLSWAEKIGPNTRELINRVLESREHPVQTYRACMGVMRLAKNYTSEVFEAASLEAIDKNTCSFKYFSIILRQKTGKASDCTSEKIISHGNVRGRGAFTGGGIRA